MTNNKLQRIIDIIFSLLFSIGQIIGYYSFKYDDTCINKISTWLYIILFTIVIYIILLLLKKISFKKNIKLGKIYNTLFNSKYSFFILTILIFLAYSFYILVFYPGNFSYDAGTQVRMANDIKLFTKYHPVIHTFIIKLTINAGFKLFHSYQLGVLIYCLIQSITMALIFAYTLLFLNKNNFSKLFNIILLIFYMVLPTFGLYSITVTKDILFAGLFNLVVIELVKLSRDNSLLNNNKYVGKLVILLLLLVMFRNNMLYSFILFLPIMIILLKKVYKKVLIIGISVLVLFVIYDKMLTYLFHIEDGPKIETFSFVVQQFARVYHKENLNKQIKNDIYSLYNNDAINDYDARISDPIKKEFNSNIVLQNKSKYLKMYVSFIFKYPKTMIDSLLINTYGFYYLGDEYLDTGFKKYIEINCLEVNNGVVLRTYNCKKKIPKLYDHYLNLYDNGKYQNNFILRILMSPALYFWIFVYVFMNLLMKKKYRIPLWIIMTYMLTNFLAPVAIVRYVFFLYTLFPLLMYMYYENESN